MPWNGHADRHSEMKHRFTDEQMRRGGCLGILTLYAAALALMAWALCSCSRTTYVPVESVRTEWREADTAAILERLTRMYESMWRQERQSDSLVDRSKETVVVNERGDTTRHDRERIVYRSTSREKELERMVARQDSCIESLHSQLLMAKTDSIAVPYPVERKLSRWEQVKMDFGGIALTGFFCLLSVAVVWIIKRNKR